MSGLVVGPYFATSVALMAFSRLSGRRSLSSSVSAELTVPSLSQSLAAAVGADGPDGPDGADEAGGTTATGEVPGLSATSGDLEAGVNLFPSFLESTRMWKRVGT